MFRRVFVCAAVVVILGFLGHRYMRNWRNEVQTQDRRAAELAQTIKAQGLEIDLQRQQIESLQHEVRIQSGELQGRLARLEGQLRAREQTSEIAQARPPRPSILRILPQASYLHMHGNTGWCGNGPAQPCDVYELGRDVQIGVALANPSDQPVSYRYLNWWPSTVIEVRDQAGHLVPETEELRGLEKKWFHNGEWTGPSVAKTQRHDGPSPEDVAVLPPHTAAGQGGSVSWGVQVTKHCDISLPGRYSIVAKVRSLYPSQKWVQSNKIWVTISPKQSDE